MDHGNRYQVALSFAGEQRAYVEEAAHHLAARDVGVFYDDFERVQRWGRNLEEVFHKTFEQQSDLVVMFVSRAYVDKAMATSRIAISAESHDP